jgi:polyhydroxyalkanoate synthase
MSKPGKADRSAADDLSEKAAQNTLTLNPLVGIRGEDLRDAAQTVLRAMIEQPQAVAQQSIAFAAELGRIFTGRSQVAPDAKDKRFADPAWMSSAPHRLMMQSYLAWADSLNRFVDGIDLNMRDEARAKLVTQIFIDSVSPANSLLGNPTALKHAVDTRGQSLIDGFKNFLDDLQKNGGLPSQVDRSAFKVGENLANTPGSVVHRNEIIELIQYTAAADEVHLRPILIVPPQINKYYAVDLAPNKSMIRFLLSQGLQPFCISWRNPTAAQKDWGFDDYIAAVDAAVDAAREITGSDDITIMGSCSGGITVAGYLGWLAAKKAKKVANLVTAVCVLDTQSADDTQFAALVTPESVLAAKQVSATRGVLDGGELARMFAWMRPNDLIWNYWVNNYLMGKQPPAFDILFWNADTTRLPMRLHHDYLDLIFTNPFVNPGKMSIRGAPIDMRKVKVDAAYVIAGTTDHITPWEACYQTARIYGPNTTFILSNSGHLQSLLNPPGNPKAWYMAAPAKQKDGESWLNAADKEAGSWWTHWAQWLAERSGGKVPKPRKDGTKKHPAKGAAPGTYVFEA